MLSSFYLWVEDPVKLLLALAVRFQALEDAVLQVCLEFVGMVLEIHQETKYVID